jgi:DNA polymerase III delta prime subunit
MIGIPWIEKYRPKSMNDMVHHSDIILILKNFIKSNDSLPHLFLYGSPGTGKTSMILNCARELYGEYSTYMVLHLNASDERGVETVRKQIVQFSSTESLYYTKLKKLVILDEADCMTEDAQIALKDVLVKYNDNVRFCFIGNYQYALIPTLKSRLVKLIFTPIPFEEGKKVINKIASEENFSLSDEACKNIYEHCAGDLRKCINLLQTISLKSKNITIKDLEAVLLCDKNDRYTYYVKLLKERDNVFDVIDIITSDLQESNVHFVSFLESFSEFLVARLESESLYTFLDDCAVIIINSCHLTEYQIQMQSFIILCHKFRDNIII